MADEREGPVPVDEMLSKAEQNRLRFLRWLFKRKPDHRAPQENIEEYQALRRNELLRRLGRH